MVSSQSYSTHFQQKDCTCHSPEKLELVILVRKLNLTKCPIFTGKRLYSPRRLQLEVPRLNIQDRNFQKETQQSFKQGHLTLNLLTYSDREPILPFRCLDPCKFDSMELVGSVQLVLINLWCNFCQEFPTNS